MKQITLLPALFFMSVCAAQFAGTSFEEPDVFTVQYVDTGDANVAHDLLNNVNEPFVDFPESNGELGYDARYEPYNTPSDGLTDGDLVGVNDSVGTVGAYTDGLQGYQISDIDGNFILEFDIVNLTGATSPEVTLDFFITETGYEGDGTVNESNSDRLRIYVKDLTNGTEIDILDTTGSDINDLAIEGRWINGSAALLPNTEVQLVIEARTNAGTEAFFFDNVVFDGTLGINDESSGIFTIFPNPTSEGYVNISSQRSGFINVEVYDVLGKLVINAQDINGLIDISGLNSGVYIMKINQDGISQTQKLIVR